MGEDPSRRACNLLAVNFRALLVFASLLLVLPATAAAAPSSKETSILREMNRVRAQYGLAALRVDKHLQRAATAHNREMVATNTFSHGAFGSRMLQYAVTGRIAGENLAWGTGSQGGARESSRPGSPVRSTAPTCSTGRSCEWASATC